MNPLVCLSDPVAALDPIWKPANAGARTTIVRPWKTTCDSFQISSCDLLIKITVKFHPFFKTNLFFLYCWKYYRFPSFSPLTPSSQLPPQVQQSWEACPSLELYRSISFLLVTLRFIKKKKCIIHFRKIPIKRLNVGSKRGIKGTL